MNPIGDSHTGYTIWAANSFCFLCNPPKTTISTVPPFLLHLTISVVTNCGSLYPCYSFSMLAHGRAGRHRITVVLAEVILLVWPVNLYILSIPLYLPAGNKRGHINYKGDIIICYFHNREGMMENSAEVSWKISSYQYMKKFNIALIVFLIYVQCWEFCGLNPPTQTCDSIFPSTFIPIYSQ